MLFKTYQKLLGASCLALYLVGCGSGGGGESPVEIRVSNNGDFQIRSKADSVTTQGVKLNRGNCVVNFVPAGEIEETVQMDVLGQRSVLTQMGVLRQITPISMQDFKDMASVYKEFDQNERVANMENKISQLEQKGVMMESQTIKFEESLKGVSKGCNINIIEAEIQTDKGAWTFNFDI
ncbi:hypothetical protein [Helicobacter pylori]|uniref:hypothetical protein n=1 Tax=Helicobacter pylori TaxID=210 RepID=UPI000EB5214E|nr:hypothetical protein [Helicobacter pylori]GHP55928.1 hypothetical protein VN0227_13390 [Helicobacter pylori]